ncbi:MAG: hypothetical protein GXP45_08440 [bacterium]|nr:hypothetical protein [bacterium]
MIDPNTKDDIFYLIKVVLTGMLVFLLIFLLWVLRVSPHSFDKKIALVGDVSEVVDLDQIKDGMKNILYHFASGENYALLSFAKNTELLVPFSHDYHMLEYYVDALSTDTQGGRDLDTMFAKLSQLGADKIILFSDVDIDSMKKSSSLK